MQSGTPLEHRNEGLESEPGTDAGQFDLNEDVYVCTYIHLPYMCAILGI